MSPRVEPLGEPFALTLDETAMVGAELRLTFTELLEESRCPLDVQCVWEGNARIELEVVTPGTEPVALQLDTHPAFTTKLSYAAYTIGLLDVEPYPRRQRPSREPPRAILLVGTREGAAEPPPEPSPEAAAPAS